MLFLCLSFLVNQGSDKTWDENEPERIRYTSNIVDESQQEEKTQVVFITLTALFFAIIVCCLIEVYRTHRAHKKRIERETDESIIRAKEQATKNQAASSTTNVKSFSYKPVGICAMSPTVPGFHHPSTPLSFLA